MVSEGHVLESTEGLLSVLPARAGGAGLSMIVAETPFTGSSRPSSLPTAP